MEVVSRAIHFPLLTDIYERRDIGYVEYIDQVNEVYMWILSQVVVRKVSSSREN